MTIIRYICYGWQMLLALCFVVEVKGQTEDRRADISPLEHAILYEDASFFYIDVKNYPVKNTSLPIGVFDSGTGGLTVLDALVRYDAYNNVSGMAGADRVSDFHKEKFIYLADQANMPYGNYYNEHKSDLLVENVLKDAQFLMADKYYPSASDAAYKSNKKPVKAIVIACNTATAYAKKDVEAFIRKSGINLKVIGVIDAGARATLNVLDKDKDASVGILATVGAVASGGYDRAITTLKDSLKGNGRISIFSQGGQGLAEAIDGEPDFIDLNTVSPRVNYRGPSLQSPEFKIDKTLLSIYRFDFSGNKMLCDSRNMDDCEDIQLNSPENYVRYHLVSLLEKIRKTPGAFPLRAVVLGCTHYPFLLREIRGALADLYNYKKKGKYVYRSVMGDHIEIVDPAVTVASELYLYLRHNDLLNAEGDNNGSEFFISVPNYANPDIRVDKDGRFTYEYKYGRNAGNIQQYVKMVPFASDNISAQTFSRLKTLMPQTYALISTFQKRNLNLNPKH